MRILVLEYVSGGGLAGRPCPPALAREGAAMRAALVADLARVPGVNVVATADPRFPLAVPGVEVVTVRQPRALRSLIGGAEAVWLIAPESGGRLARLAAAVEAAGVRLLGPSAAAIRIAADKLGLARRLEKAGLPVPATHPLRRATRCMAGEPGAAPCRPTYPLVLKPVRGAGCEGVSLARADSDLTRAVRLAIAAVAPRGRVLAQSYVDGVPASVSLLCDGSRALPLAVNRQHVRAGLPFSYEGGETPFEHPLAGRAIERAVAACGVIPGLRGYVGVDLVLTEGDAVILEINPRLTTSYLGLRRAVDENLAAAALEAALWRLPAAPRIIRRVQFLASGAIAGEEPLA